ACYRPPELDVRDVQAFRRCALQPSSHRSSSDQAARSRWPYNDHPGLVAPREQCAQAANNADNISGHGHAHGVRCAVDYLVHGAKQRRAPAEIPEPKGTTNDDLVADLIPSGSSDHGPDTPQHAGVGQLALEVQPDRYA